MLCKELQREDPSFIEADSCYSSGQTEENLIESSWYSDRD